MKKKLKIIVIILLFFALSCTEDFYDDLATNDKVPDKEAVLAVNSFEISNALVINWNEDEGAEEYILYKDMLYNGSFTEIAYRGLNLSYTDNDVPNDNIFYYYKLSKKRGQKEFDKSRYKFGISSICLKDSFENNDTIVKAADINNMLQINANIYYARDGYYNELLDTDWYSVTINGGMRVKYQIIFDQLAKNGGGGFSPGYNGIVSVYKNNAIQDLSDTSLFIIENPSKSVMTCNFAILINKINFLNAGNAFGKRIEAYSLHLIDVTLIP